MIQSIDIEHFITEFLMLRIEYASFAEDDAGRIGFLADGATPLLVHQDGKIIPFVFPKDTIVLDKFLLAEKEQGRRRFTMAHEASHHILSKMYAMPSEGHFHAEYDSEREFITYYQGADYYGLGLKMFTRLAHEAGAVYKIGKKVLIRRTIFDEYLRQQYHIEQMASLAADGKEASTRQGSITGQ